MLDIPDLDRAVLIDATRELLRRALLTLSVTPDPDIRHRMGPKSSWPPYVRETRDAYASAPPKFRSFTPERADLARMIEVLSWLDWYARQSKETAASARLFRAWVAGAPMWMLQERVRTNRNVPASVSTVRNRRSELVAAIVEQFRPRIQKMAIDGLWELAEKGGIPGHDSEFASTALELLPKSPTAWKHADVKPLAFSHPDAVAGRKAAAEQDLLRRREYKQATRKLKKKTAAKKPRSSVPAPA